VPRPSKYPERFRRDAVELVRSSGRSLREVGKELGVSHETLRNWVNAATAEAGESAPDKVPLPTTSSALVGVDVR
jgi:transposase